MIEGRVVDGQKQYSADMDAAVRQEVELQQQRRLSGLPNRLNRIISSTQSRRSSSSSRRNAQQKPRFVRFLSSVSTTSLSSFSGQEESDEKVATTSASSDAELEPSWMEKQQSPPAPSYLGLHHHYRQSRAHQIRLGMLVVLLSLALTLIILRLSI